MFYSLHLRDIFGKTANEAVRVHVAREAANLDLNHMLSYHIFVLHLIGHFLAAYESDRLQTRGIVFLGTRLHILLLYN